MKVLPVAEMNAQLSTYLDLAATEGPIIITRNGKAAAVLIAPVDETKLEELSLIRSLHPQAAPDSTIRNGRSIHPSATQAAPLPTPAESGLRAQGAEEREQRFKQTLLEMGLLKKINNPTRSKPSPWRPIPTKGKPASQMIIEDRR